MKHGHLRLKVSGTEVDYLMSRFAKRYFASYHRPGRRKSAKRMFNRRVRRYYARLDHGGEQ